MTMIYNIINISELKCTVEEIPFTLFSQHDYSCRAVGTWGRYFNRFPAGVGDWIMPTLYVILLPPPFRFSDLPTTLSCSRAEKHEF